MARYNQRKYESAPLPENWADDVEPKILTAPGKPRQLGPKQRNRIEGWKGRTSKSGDKVPLSASRTITDPAEITPLVVKATKEKLTNELRIQWARWKELTR